FEMSERDMQPVLRCERCNKPFDKPSTLKRHGYYCQSRKEGGAATRHRSCVSCARRKARCDNKRPACSGCVARAVECHYPSNTSKGEPRSRRSGDASPVQSAQWLMEVDSSPTASHHHPPFDTALVASDPTPPTTPEEVYLGWDDPAIDLIFADLINPQTSDNDTSQSSSASSSTVDRDSPSTASSIVVRGSPPRTIASSPRMSILRQPPYLLGSFIPRPKIEIGTQKTANLVLHTLKSYPLMLLRHNTPPPFIHPRFLSSSSIEHDEMEPLNNCISLLHMFSSRVPASRKLFWKNVRMECERFHQEYLGWAKRELLAALQALSVYVIIRLDEGQTDHNNFDFLMVAAVAAVATQLGRLDAATDKSLEMSWETWIFGESQRRLCVIYQIVNMLVQFEPAVMCHRRQTDLVIAPLPAKKHLWEAGDEFAWKAESGRGQLEGRVAFALAANGELVQLNHDEPHCGKPLDISPPPWRSESWDEWASGMDGFGGLVMLAASLTV
ncbi:hypothetical protein C8A00DRAFT_12487, partial [Chaetomidium leptoderma]